MIKLSSEGVDDPIPGASTPNAVKHADVFAATERIEGAPCVSVDASAFLGTWVNTWRDTRTITRFVLSEADGGYAIDTYVAGGTGYLGSTEAVPFSPDVNSRQADGFSASYDFGFEEMLLTAYFVKGLIVVSQYTRFKDGSGRPDYFNREFFFHQEDQSEAGL